MKLKRLQLQGFKSFVDRTEIQFDQQICGVVGPNGCGKSNIVDAIRWAMGEQSAKGLRGKEMLDVVFAGTPSRKAAGLAEVSLVFDNSDKQAPAPYTDVAEVSVTRRLYRSGESEYLINKVVVRLKDVNDLFLGTGSSAKAYSIVAQGKVDQIVLAKPEERRFLIEEAAGIAKYKVRKQSAERKMEATHQNLQRVEDILQELERSSRSLERQVERAEKFRDIQKELRQIDEQLTTAKVRALDQRASENESDLQRSRENHVAVSTQVLEAEAQLEKFRLEALHLEKLNAQEFQQLIEKKDSSAKLETEKQLGRQRMDLLTNQSEERRKDIERLRSKSQDQESSKEKLQQELSRLETQKRDQELIHQEFKAKLETISLELEVADQQVEALRARVEEARLEQGRQRQKLEYLQTNRVNLELRRSELEQLLDDLVRQREAKSSEVQKILAALEAAKQESRLLESLEAELEQRLAEQNVEQQELVRNRFGLERRRAEIQERLKSIHTLDEHQVGYLSGVREFEKMTGLPPALKQIEFKNEFEELGAQLLSEIGQCFATDPQVTIATRWIRIRSQAHHRSFDTSCWNLVRSCENSELEKILRSIEFVDELSSEILDRPQFDRRGHLRLPVGREFVLDCAGRSEADQSPVARQLEGDNLRREELKVASELASVDGQILTSEKGSTELKLKLEDIESNRRRLREWADAETGNLRRSEESKARLEVLCDQYLLELRGIETKVADILRELQSIQSDHIIVDLEEQMKALQLTVTQKQNDKVECESIWIEKRIEAGALSEKIERIREQTTAADMARSEYAYNQGIYRQDIENWQREIQKLRDQLTQADSDQQRLQQETIELESRLATARERLNWLNSECERLEFHRKEAQLAKDQAQVKVQELELERQNLKFQVEELAQLLFERYQMSLQDLVSQSEELLPPEWQEGEWLRRNEERAQYLRDRLQKFGDVNLVALQEYEEVKKRLEFMSSQKQDLLNTLNSLQSIIERINKITEFRFRETFKSINHNFQILFPKLFGGGKAFMSLTDDHNLLDAGVEIFAEPPGKKIQAMSLLSGGEKAMTSISLIFSLFAYRPSSFCILDEVDAPLDDVNTRRYNEIIQEMSSLSQFIVITHNKRTMEVAQTLFGVTMQEPGCSKIVGVNLQEARAFTATTAISSNS